MLLLRCVFHIHYIQEMSQLPQPSVYRDSTRVQEEADLSVQPSVNRGSTRVENTSLGLLALAHLYNTTHPISGIDSKYLNTKEDLVFSLWARGVHVPHHLAYGEVFDHLVSPIVPDTIKVKIDEREYLRVRSLDDNALFHGRWYAGEFMAEQNVHDLSALNPYIFFTDRHSFRLLVEYLSSHTLSFSARRLISILLIPDGSVLPKPIQVVAAIHAVCGLCDDVDASEFLK
jgi:hypothetical protein